ncbi:MAG: CsgG/HfaB family protein [Cytophagales bacterium]|nr:CsgG/HfaB family protein [Cytophagales bacterium]
MMKKFFTLLLVSSICVSNYLLAQEKQSIGIVDFDFTEGVGIKVEDVAVVQDLVTNSFINSKRFNILEREMVTKLKEELEYQKEEDFLNNISSLAEQGKMVGASYMLLGKVSKLTIEETNVKEKTTNSREKNSSSTVKEVDAEYIAFVTVTLRVVNVETGEVNGSSTLNIQPSLIDRQLFAADTRGAALRKITKPLGKQVDKFIGEYLPIEMGIGAVKEEQKGKVREIYISAGSKLGLSNGMGVVIIKKSFQDIGTGDPIKIEKQIAEGKVIELLGEQASLVQIKKGGDLLKKEIGNDATLVCKTKG